MGATPIVGLVTFFWYIDANADGKMQISEYLGNRDRIPNDKGVAVAYYYWTPETSQLGRKVRLAVSAGYLDPGADSWDYVDTYKVVTVRGQ